MTGRGWRPGDTPPTEQELEDAAITEMTADIETPKRGRPAVPDDQKRSEKLTLSFTPSEFKELLHAAADADDGPFTAREWGRELLLKTARKQ